MKRAFVVFDDPSNARFAWSHINNNLLAMDYLHDGVAWVEMSHPRSITVDLSNDAVREMIEQVAERFEGQISDINSAPWVQPEPDFPELTNYGQIIQLERAAIRRNAIFTARGMLSPFKDVV